MPLHEGDGRSVAAVVTAYRIGPVLSDTLLSLLSQRDAPLDLIVLVVDGCPLHRTTRTIAQRFGRSAPGFRTIWLENGGVSRARNIGVRAILTELPEVDAIFLLDGDDLIPPRTLASTLRRLDHARIEPTTTRPGWVYFDQVQFGAEEMALRYPSTFVPARWLASNLSQPSCLYAADMFREGVFWDEDMRHGIEDWEFWYSAHAAGFHGVHDPDMTLKYRRLTGNRSSLNRSKDSLTKRYMRTKHRALLTPKSLLRDEAQTHPRWAVRAPGDDAWRLTNDPCRHGTRVPSDRPARAFAAREAQYGREAVFVDPYFPDMVAILPAPVRHVLADLGMLRAIFLKAERALAETPLVSVQLAEGEATSIAQQMLKGPLSRLEDAEAIFASTTGLRKHLRDSAPPTRPTPKSDRLRKPGWLELRRLSGRRKPDTGRPKYSEATASVAELSDMPITCLTVSHRAPLMVGIGGAHRPLAIVDELAEQLASARQLLGDAAYLRSENRHCGMDKANHLALWKELTGLLPPLPVNASPGVVNVALVLPSVIPAALEWLLSRLNSESDLRFHLVHIGREFPPSTELALAASTPRFHLEVPDDVGQPSHDLTYVGTPLFERSGGEWQTSAVSLLAGMDVVVDFAGPVMAGPMMVLKKLGVETAVCPPEDGQATDPFDTASASEWAAQDIHSLIAYSAAYTHVLCQSETQSSRLCALGMQRAATDVGAARLMQAIAERRGNGLEDATDNALARAS